MMPRYGKPFTIRSIAWDPASFAIRSGIPEITTVSIASSLTTENSIPLRHCLNLIVGNVDELPDSLKGYAKKSSYTNHNRKMLIRWWHEFERLTGAKTLAEITPEGIQRWSKPLYDGFAAGKLKGSYIRMQILAIGRIMRYACIKKNQDRDNGGASIALVASNLRGAGRREIESYSHIPRRLRKALSGSRYQGKGYSLACP